MSFQLYFGHMPFLLNCRAYIRKKITSKLVTEVPEISRKMGLRKFEQFVKLLAYLIIFQSFAVPLTMLYFEKYAKYLAKDWRNPCSTYLKPQSISETCFLVPYSSLI